MSQSKPRADKFPLWKHQNGQWCKVIAGHRHYLGNDPEVALSRYQAILRGEDVAGDRVDDLIRSWLKIKERLVPAEIKHETLTNYKHFCVRISQSIGHRIISSLTFDDFSQLRADLSKGVKPATLQNQLTLARMLMTHAVDAGYTLPYKKALKAPAARILRAARQEKGALDFTREQVLALLGCEGPIRAATLVGINLAYGPTDIALMPMSAIQGEYCEWPRPKSAVERRGWLWPETRDALDSEGPLAFKWSRRMVSHFFRKRLQACGIKGRGFYGLRKTFSTVASDTGNSFAINRVMGHTEKDVPSLYRQRISDDQLKRVCSYVRDWVFTEKPAEV
jgi:integrase